MPCDSGPLTSDDYASMFRHEIEAMAALCELCATLNEAQLTPKAAKWWRKHQERDRKRLDEEWRKAKEKKDKEALLKRLSKYERSLLKI